MNLLHLSTPALCVILALSPVIAWALIYAVCFAIMLASFVSYNLYRWARKVKTKAQQPDSDQQQQQSKAAP